MKERVATTLTIVLILGFSSAPSAEYLIYLKGGHYIVADNCTFSTHQESGQRSLNNTEPQEELVLVEDCTKGKPEGRIFWSTIDGKFGEVNADDVYAILGSNTSTPKKPPPAKGPLEDYLITNRGESFVNAKTIQEKEDRVYGMKRDDLAKINRRSVAEIAPEGQAKSRSGEGLCAGEPAEFSVTETELVGGHLVGVVTNLSKTPWKPRIDVVVEVKGKRLGKFQIEDPNMLAPNDNTTIDKSVPPRFLKHLERITDPEASVRICYRKVKI
jgi:hypothetical protein